MRQFRSVVPSAHMRQNCWTKKGYPISGRRELGSQYTKEYPQATICAYCITAVVTKQILLDNNCPTVVAKIL